MRKRTVRGNIAAIILVLVLAIGAVAYFMFTRKPSQSGGLQPLLTKVPASAEVFLAVDGSALPVDSIVERYRSFVSKLDEEKKKDVKEAEQAFGATPEELVSWFGRSGYLAMLAPEGGKGLVPANLEQPEFLVAGVIALQQPDKVRALIDKHAAKEAQEKTIEGATFRFVEEEFGYAIDGDWLLMVSSEKTAEIVLKTLKGQSQGITENAQVKEALQKVAEAKPELLMFANLQDSVAAALELPEASASIDQQTKDGLGTLRYAAFGLGFTSGESLGLLRVEPGQAESKFATALLQTPGIQGNSARFSPVDTQTFAALNLRYLYKVGMETAMLFPEARSQASMVPAGLAMGLGIDLEEGVWQTLDGEVGYTSNALEAMKEIFSSNFVRARSQGQLTACKSNLKNIATACEMYSTDYSGLYPTEMGQLAPNYLRAIPTCPSAGNDTYTQTYEVNNETYVYTFACGGHHHASQPEGQPYYSGTVGLVSEYSDSPSDDEPGITFLGIVPGPDAAKLNKFMDDMVAKGKFKLSSKQVAGVEAHSVTAEDLFGVVEKPTPAFLIAAGDNPEAMFKQAVEVQNAVYDQPEFQKMLKWGGDGIITLQFYDLQKSLELLKTELDKVEVEDQDEKMIVNEIRAFLDDLPQLRGAAALAAKPDGIYQRSTGTNMMKFTGLLGVGAAILVPNFIRARSQGQTTACKSNLKNIATACEMYSTDYSGRYPENTSLLTPNYLRVLPTCPAAGEDTYSPSYQSKTNPDHYTFYCKGNHHPDLPEDKPGYNSVEGLTY